MTKLPPLSIWRTLPTPPTTIRGIATSVAQTHGFSLDDILAQNRQRGVSRARHAAFAACRDAGFSFPQIGRRLDRDHSTVIHGDQAHRRRLAVSMAAE